MSLTLSATAPVIVPILSITEGTYAAHKGKSLLKLWMSQTQIKQIVFTLSPVQKSQMPSIQMSLFGAFNRAFQRLKHQWHVHSVMPGHVCSRCSAGERRIDGVTAERKRKALPAPA